jgi:hypothetical protein
MTEILESLTRDQLTKVQLRLSRRTYAFIKWPTRNPADHHEPIRAQVRYVAILVARSPLSRRSSKWAICWVAIARRRVVVGGIYFLSVREVSDYLQSRRVKELCSIDHEPLLTRPIKSPVALNVADLVASPIEDRAMHIAMCLSYSAGTFDMSSLASVNSASSRAPGWGRSLILARIASRRCRKTSLPWRRRRD